MRVFGSGVAARLDDRRPHTTSVRDNAEAFAKAGFFILLCELPVTFLPVMSPRAATLALSVWLPIIAWITFGRRTDEEFFVGLRARAGGISPRSMAIGLGLVLTYCAGSVIAQVLYVSLVGAPPSSEIELTMYQPGGWVPFLIIAVVLAPVVEEAALRGFLQGYMQTKYGARAATVVAAVAFSVLHLDPVAMPLFLLDGLLFGLVAWRTGSFWIPAAMHAAGNLAILLLGLRFGPSSSAADFPAQTGISLMEFAAIFLVLAVAFASLIRSLNRESP